MAAIPAVRFSPRPRLFFSTAGRGLPAVAAPRVKSTGEGFGAAASIGAANRVAQKSWAAIRTIVNASIGISPSFKWIFSDIAFEKSYICHHGRRTPD